MSLNLPSLATGKRPDIAALRAKLERDFPSAVPHDRGVFATGVEAIDNALGGGLPKGAVSEITGVPGCGGQLLLLQLLRMARLVQGFVALVDGSDAFDPESAGEALLEHLLWVRCREPNQVIKAADVLSRDENFPLLLLDLRGNATAAIRRIPSASWYRLQRVVRQTGTTLVVMTASPAVPSAQVRLELTRPFSLGQIDAEREDLLAKIEFTITRQRIAFRDDQEADACIA